MTWIEGIGDEVTLFFTLLLVIFIGIVAWVSTSITDQPLIRTVLILERRSVVHRQNLDPVESNSLPPVEPRIDTRQPINASNGDGDEDFASAAYLPCDNNLPQDRQVNGPTLEPDLPASEPLTEEQESEASPFEGVRSPDRADSDHVTEADTERCSLRSLRLAYLNSRQPTLLEEEIQPEPRTAESNINNVGNIRIRLKYLNDDQKMVEGKLEEQLGDFKRRHFSPELSADKLVRLIFNGHVLQSDNETLQSCGLFDNCVVHCLVHPQRANATNQMEFSAGRESNTGSNPSTTTEGLLNREWDMGNILLISLSLLLGVAWYCRFLYGQLFNATTTVALAGLTGILVISLVGIYMPDQDLALRT